MNNIIIINNKSDMLEPSNNITGYLRTYVIVTLTEKDHEKFFYVRDKNKS